MLHNKNSSKTYYLTTPIYYVNDIPHIGHFYTTLACDVIARFKRLKGERVFFATGTDEHGIKIENRARVLNEEPQQLVDRLSTSFQELFKQSEFTHDAFIRTTSERHQRLISWIWSKLLSKGYIYKGFYEGFYSVSDEAFYSHSEVTKNEAGELVASATGSAVTTLEEESFFFKLSEFQDKLLDFYQSHPDFVGPSERFNEVKSFVKSGLNDLSVSRVKVKWGIPVPGEPNHTVYVWLDALCNYLTVAGYLEYLQAIGEVEESREGLRSSVNPPAYASEELHLASLSANFKDLWPANLHMVGKDILRFHTVYWPAFLMALELPLPAKVFAHGWWTNNKQKMSKSLGNAIYPQDLIATYGLDETKYFMLREIPFGNDGDFSPQAITRRVNNELANAYGNLCQRCLALANNQLGGVIAPTAINNPKAQHFQDAIKATYHQAQEFINKQAFSLYLDTLWEVIRELNSYMNEAEPWKLLKEGHKEEASEVLYVVINTLKDISLLLLPIVPNIASNALRQMGYQGALTFEELGRAQASYKVTKEPTPIARKYIENKTS